MTFGERLKKLREEHNLSQAALGGIIGVSERLVSYYETDQRYPNKLYIFLKLSGHFDVSVDYLIGKDESVVDSRFEDIISEQIKDAFDNVYLLFASGYLSPKDRDEFLRRVTCMHANSR